MINSKKGSVDIKLIVILVVIILAACIYYLKSQPSNAFSISGYVAYESPAGDPGYDFFIISASSTTVGGALPTMEGFPSITDPDYRYISYAKYKSTLPNVGDKISVIGTIDDTVETNPPYTFAYTASKISVLLDAQFNSTVQGLIQAIQ